MQACQRGDGRCLEPFFNVFALRHSELAALLRFRSAHVLMLAVSSDQDTHIPVKGVQLSDALREVVGENNLALFLHQARHRQKRLQVFF